MTVRGIALLLAGLLLGGCVHTQLEPASEANLTARDKYRHPQEVLGFFGLKPDMTVVEIWPGGGYWTERLGPT